MNNENIICGSLQSLHTSSSGKTIIEDSKGYHEMELDALHLSQGRIFIDDEINRHTADSFASQMLHLSDEQKPVIIYINSPGGEVNAGLMMYDIIRSYPYNVDIYCTGLAASMGAVLLSVGKKGHRFILPHSRVMIHEPLLLTSGGGSASDIEKRAQAMLETRALINGILAENCGKTLEEVNEATRFDNFMDAQQAISFGICDKIASLF